MQSKVLFVMAETVGDGITETFASAEDVQVLGLVPVTVKTVVTLGITTTIDPVTAPFQVYVFAPLTVNVADWPIQNAGGLIFTVRFGRGRRTTIADEDAVQPLTAVPITL